MKRILASILAAAMLLMLLPAALAETIALASTPLNGASDAMRQNISIAASRINGLTMAYGDSFSFNDTVGPRTNAYGYQSALNGRGKMVTGGGVAQVASTLYLALRQLDDDIIFNRLSTYGSKFTGNYVSSGRDAILVDYSSGIDFAFTNNSDDFMISVWASSDTLYCELNRNHTFGAMMEPPVFAEAEEEAAYEAYDEDYNDSYDDTYDELPDLTAGEPIFLDWNAAPSMQQVRLPIASAEIQLNGSQAQVSNIRLAAESINDTMISCGDRFSFNEIVGPRSEKCGYRSALNGRGAEVTGGGVAQVASVIWLAVKNLDCVAVVQKATYGERYNQDYVSNSNDAILTDYSAGTDFSFRNVGSAPLVISTGIEGSTLYCRIYQE